MKGFARTVLSVEDENISSKFQDILAIVKQMGEHGRLKTIIQQGCRGEITGGVPSGVR
jgi:hypothetical protein